MHSNETNKIACAVLAVLTFSLGLSIFSGELFKPRRPAQPAFSVAEPESAQGPAQQQAAAPTAVNMAEVMGQADAARGQQAFRQCQSCHAADEAGGNRQGPNLHGVVGRQIGSVPNFNYSRALQAARAENKTWGYEELYRFIENPRGTMPGTTMAFAGVRRSGERADIIAYLRQQSPNAPAPPQ
jgi:cytochrome c